MSRDGWTGGESKVLQEVLADLKILMTPMTLYCVITHINDVDIDINLHVDVNADIHVHVDADVAIDNDDDVDVEAKVVMLMEAL